MQNTDPLPELLAQLRRPGIDFIHAQEAIVVLVGKRAVAPLIRLLDEPDDETRWSACHVLGLLRDRRAVAPIVSRVDRFGWNGPLALGQLGGRSASDALLRLLGSSTSFFLRIAAIRALGTLREERAIPALIALLPEGHGHGWGSEGIGDTDPGDNAATSLGQLGKAAGDALVGALDHPDPFVRERAATALIKVKSRRALPKLLKQLDQETLPALAAARALAALREKSAIPQLSLWLKKTKAWQTTAIDCLGDIGEESTLPLLIELAEGADRELARRATNAMGGIRSDASFMYLVRYAERDMYAYRTLGGQRHPRAFRYLTERLTKTNHETASIIADALRELGDARAVPLLMARAKEAGPAWSWEFYTPIALMGKEGVKAIGPLVQSANEGERENAITALGTARDREALPYLKPLLKHSDTSIVRETISALFEILTENRLTGP